MTHEAAGRLKFTRRALRDILDIRDYSVSQWGKRVADEYQKDIDSALERIASRPDLLWEEPDFHPDLKFFRVNKHLLERLTVQYPPSATEVSGPQQFTGYRRGIARTGVDVLSLRIQSKIQNPKSKIANPDSISIPR